MKLGSKNREDISDRLREGSMVGDWRLGHSIGTSRSSMFFQVSRSDNRVEKESLVMAISRGSLSKSFSRDLIRFYISGKVPMFLQCPGTPIVHAVDRVDGIHFKILSRLSGRSLFDTVQTNGVYSVEAALQKTKQACRIVQTAHKHQMYHRNLNPNKMFVCNQGQIVITGWGSTRIEGLGIDELDKGKTIGIPAYSPPEQMIEPAKADSSSDVFSLCASLFFMITGETPFPARSPRVCLKQKTSSVGWRHDLIERGCPRSLIGLFDRVFCKQRKRQVRTLPHLERVLRRIAGRLNDPPEIMEPVVESDSSSLASRFNRFTGSIKKKKDQLVKAIYTSPQN